MNKIYEEETRENCGDYSYLENCGDVLTSFYNIPMGVYSLIQHYTLWSFKKGKGYRCCDLILSGKDFFYFRIEKFKISIVTNSESLKLKYIIEQKLFLDRLVFSELVKWGNTSRFCCHSLVELNTPLNYIAALSSESVLPSFYNIPMGVYSLIDSSTLYIMVI